MEYELEKGNTIQFKICLNMEKIPKSTSDLWGITKYFPRHPILLKSTPMSYLFIQKLRQ